MEHLERADVGIAVVTVIKSDKSDKRKELAAERQIFVYDCGEIDLRPPMHSFHV